MKIKQWKDENLSQYSYAILSDCQKQLVLIDPSRNPQPYLQYAKEMTATIIGIIETHPHADFASSHSELSNSTGAPVYCSSLVGAAYPHVSFDDGNTIEFGKIKLKALNTPGHSPDSISVLLEHDGKPTAIFSGDTLFINDCGRPDLREDAGNLKATRVELAKDMYHSLRNKFLPLNDAVLLYPAHGAGTLCGKGLSDADSSTMGDQKQNNWSLQWMTEQAFVEKLLTDQPFVPAYFPYDVALNRNGAAPFKKAVDAVVISNPIETERDAAALEPSILVVDSRQEKNYKAGHLQNAVNLMEGTKFETWLGSIIQPEEPFYLAGENIEQVKRLIERAAAIGYEPFIKKAFVANYAAQSDALLNLQSFRENTAGYTIVDVRNSSEVKKSKPFAHSISIPLPELRKRLGEIPTNKPVVVHCAAGYRSAAGSSIINLTLHNTVAVYDLGEAIREFL